jgi:UDP-2-acetamido-2-deoxy-ribo-hexuluronate aminotransferase
MMENIQMVDLKGQYNYIKNEIDLEINQVLNTTAFINGPVVNEFQKDLEKYNQVKHVIPCANGTDALQIALMALGLQPGDEVITTDFTFAATVEVITLLRLIPVLVDVDIETFNISTKEIENAITSKTKAIIPVHLFGQVADMDGIIEIAKKNNLFIIEDNAQSIGASFTNKLGKKKKTGSIGDVSATSFFPSKNLGAYGDGGAIFTNNSDLEKKIRGIVNHGMYKRYYHDVIGVNSRLDSIQAAVLKVKLKYLDYYNDRRIKAASIYDSILHDHSNIITPYRKGDSESHVYHQYTLRVIGKNRDKLVEYLNENKIPCGVYYPVPLHRQKAYKRPEYYEKKFNITNRLVNEVISLPMHSEITEDQIDFISKKILDFCKK